MSAAAEKELLLQLHPNLNEKSEVFFTYLNNDSLKHEIEKLKLEYGTKFASLVEALEVDWDSAATFLIQEASTRRQHTEKSAIAHDVSVVLLRVVEKHQSDHPQEVKNESIRKQHHHVVAAIVVEAAYEISTGRTGAFAPALFGTKWRELSLKTAQRKRSSKKDSASRIQALEEECKAKDTEIASLNTILDDASKQHQEDMYRHLKNLQPVEDLRLKLEDAQTLNRNLSAEISRLERCSNAYHKKAENFELDNMRIRKEMDGMVELANQLTRASLSLTEARTELARVRESLAHEESSKKKQRERMSIKTKDLEDQVKVADDRAARAEERMKSIAWAGNYINARIDCDLRVSDAEEFAKQEMLTAQGWKRIAKQAEMRADLWKQEYTSGINSQWKAFDRMPHATWVLFQPYITIPTGLSSAESSIEREITLSGL